VSPTPSPEDGNKPSLRNVAFFAVFRIPDDGQVQKPTESEYICNYARICAETKGDLPVKCPLVLSDININLNMYTNFIKSPIQNFMKISSVILGFSRVYSRKHEF
jgi:hypothetical protein